VTWTKGIDAKTGRPVDYDPNRDVQIYAEAADVNDDKVTRTVCPNHAGGNNHWPRHLQPQHQAHLHSRRRRLRRHHQ